MKRYEVDYYQISYEGEDKQIKKSKFLGTKEFFHQNSVDFPVERKAFLLASENLRSANALKIREIRR